MLANGQTLRHKKTNQLVRLVPEPGEMWAWNIGKKTAFIAEDGTKFVDDIDNYTNIKDELGRPYFRLPIEGQFVDESAKKYFVSTKKLVEMRQKKLEEWETDVLGRMKNGGPKPIIKTIKGIKSTTYPPHSSDVAHKHVGCPFADGSQSLLFEKFFLKRRGAVPVYKVWNSILKKYVNGPMIFRHTDGKIWMYERSPSELVIIKDIRVIFGHRPRKFL